MYRGKMQRRLEKALHKLEPSSAKVTAASDDGEGLLVRVISEKFEGLPLTTRIQMCQSQVGHEDTELDEIYFLTWNCLTAKELKENS